jgi:hypothetical protein
MRQPANNVSAKVWLALALGAVGLSSSWVWRQQSLLRQLRGEETLPVLSGSAYTAVNWRAYEAKGHSWPKLPTQSQGSGWRYEMFTPPVIYYDDAAQTFAINLPQHPAEPDDFLPGLQLLAVKLEPYRLQLCGYFGAPGDYLAVLVSPRTPETFLARAGRRFEELGLTLKSFDVSKVIVESGQPGPEYDIAALAVLQDEQTGAEVVLDNRACKLTDTPLAVFRFPGATGQPRELHEGDTFSSDGVNYLIGRIQLDPPEVVVARTTAGLPAPEMRVLRPAAQLGAKSTRPQILSQQPGRGVASSH